jgi:hypothetical protein
MENPRPFMEGQLRAVLQAGSQRQSASARAPLQVLAFAWHAIRLPPLMFLVILEPLLTFLLAGLALLGILATLFFSFVGPPHFPMWTMLAISIGLGVALVPYHALIRMLSR